MSLEDKLLEMKKKISNCQKQLDQQQGKKEGILERLKKDYGISEQTLSSEIERLEEDIAEEEEKLEAAVDKLYNKYDWEE
jgi:seryl-tRNA synthetase